ncbi:NUDIX domain-containing protein [Microlunatus elymi]|uniref:NUDIX domain-containing protein n=1 Tax=Microlunatus elymi TaxID=2596828 RepID=A0A516Q496_9ACTN|nr:NUDIX domain-containing protein [Microlunatus elymi]QDP98238.1 NUDIX domain-containing protein [Microlunatus elymi]
MKIIQAAGAAVLRDGPHGREVLIIHRPRYDDWTLPKGKLEPFETFPEGAVREVAEEASSWIRLLSPLDRTSHLLSESAEKIVAWWRADAIGPTDGQVKINISKDGLPEVDEVRWCGMAEAAARLSYAQDRSVVEQAANQPYTTPLIVVRHAKAINRKDWDGTEADRPLRARGRVQARRLAPLLSAYGVQELVTSPWRRCAATVQPYALAHKIKSEQLPILSEAEGSADPDAVAATMRRIAERAVVEHRPIAVCGHRPVLPTMFAALELPERAVSTAECVVVHLTDTGAVHAVETHRPLA